MNMAYALMQSLDENWLFRARPPSSFTARDVADLAFLYMIGLHIMRCEYETAPIAMRYARQTASHSNFKSLDRNNTDLYQFLNILSDPHGAVADQLAHRDANEVLWHDMHFNPNQVRQFLTNVAANKYDHQAQKRLLFNLESQLHITVSNYRSMRRIAVEWTTNEIDTEAQRLTITRLLQAMRAKARRGDLLPWLEKLSTHRRYELFGVCDPETGKGCDEPTTEKPASAGMGFLKALALGALAGGAIGHYVGKRK